jgi:hypothetical protein
MTELIGIAAVAIVAWFAGGTILNVRKGRETMRWMQGGGSDAGLRVIGDRTTVRWLGSTAVELVIDQGKAQFSRAAVVIFLEPRDLPWWPLSRLRGRRDTLIVRGVLRKTPSLELEALDPRSWSGRPGNGPSVRPRHPTTSSCITSPPPRSHKPTHSSRSPGTRG